jgi:hypothetical protein
VCTCVRGDTQLSSDRLREREDQEERERREERGKVKRTEKQQFVV